MNKLKQQRIETANKMLDAIASTGRKFFRHNGEVCRLELGKRDRIFFVDSYSRGRIYTHYKGRWKDFTHGGTLKGLVEQLRDYVATGKLLKLRTFGKWPQWVCDGDLWGYGEDMESVREAAASLGIIEGAYDGSAIALK